MIHTANIVWVTEYLDCYALQWIEGLLRFTLEFQGKRNGQLSALAEFYANIQESSLKCKLEAASYQLASEADARLVGGTDRPESVSQRSQQNTACLNIFCRSGFIRFFI